MKIYFAGSIRGGREQASVYNKIIQYLQQQGHTVLTEHVGDSELPDDGEQLSEVDIYERDILWLGQADAVIADVTIPSLGVGYEVALAKHVLNKPILCIAGNDANVSAMIAGSPVKLLHYVNPDHAIVTVGWWLQKFTIVSKITDHNNTNGD